MPKSTPSLDVLADQYVNYLVVEKGLSAQTIESYSRDLARYLDFLRERGIRDIAEADTPFILKHLIELRNAGLGSSSRARHLVTLRGFYRFLVQEKVLKHDPARLVDLPKSGLKLPDILSVQEVNHLLKTPDTEKPIGCRDAAMIGSTAFLAPEIRTVPSRTQPPSISSASMGSSRRGTSGGCRRRAGGIMALRSHARGTRRRRLAGHADRRRTITNQQARATSMRSRPARSGSTWTSSQPRAVARRAARSPWS